MIKKCKNPKCNKEFNATGKRAFCSDKCRMAFNYQKKTGKATEPEKKPTTKKSKTEDQKPDRELTGLVVKVTTTPSEKKQVYIEFDLIDSSGISDFLKKPAKVLFYSEIEEEKEEPGPTDDLFS